MSCGAGAAGLAPLRSAVAADRVTRCCSGCRLQPATEQVPSIEPEALVAAARSGDPRSLARLVSLVENGSPELRPVLRAVAPYTGNAHVVGLTGSPGVGKSTLTARLVGAYRAAGRRVAVLAVAPTSPFS